MKAPADRVGLGWRPELAGAIFAHLDRIDVVEVVADGYLDAPRERWRALRTLAAQVPLTLHGVGLGLASREGLPARRLARLARLVEAVGPESWSEHLAIVRGGGREIGHLAAAPRAPQTVDACARNLDLARAAVGGAPLVENVATLVDPPGSVLPEDAWLGDVLDAGGAGLLLDLHNLYANAVNFGFDPYAFLARLPPERIAAVHVAGGRWIAAPPDRDGLRRARRLDDHLHDVPAAVFALLVEVARRVPHALTVVLERDGAYPPFETLLADLERARAALRAGRERCRVEGSPSMGGEAGAGARVVGPRAASPVPPSDAFLARLYTATPRRVRALAEAEISGAVDGPGLELAAASFARKRRQAAECRVGHGGRLGPAVRRLWRVLGRAAGDGRFPGAESRR